MLCKGLQVLCNKDRDAPDQMIISLNKVPCMSACSELKWCQTEKLEVQDFSEEQPGTAQMNRPLASLNEFTTYFHELSKNESTNFFIHISKLKRNTNSLLVKKGIIFLSFEHLKKSKKIIHRGWWVTLNRTGARTHRSLEHDLLHPRILRPKALFYL